MIEKLNVKRSRQKIIVYSIVIIWLVSINIWLLNTYYLSSSSSAEELMPTNSIYNEYETSNEGDDDSKDITDSSSREKSVKDELIIKILQKQLSKAKDTRTMDTPASIYKSIFEKHDIDSIFGNLDFDQRCQLFFKNLFIRDHNWIFNPNEDIQLENKNEFKFNDYKKWHMEEYKTEFAKQHHKNVDEVEHTPQFEDFVKAKYEDFWNRTMTYEQKIVDHVSTLRIFNKCFITSDNKTQISQTNQFIKDQFKLVDGVRRVSKKPSTPAFVSSKEENLVSFHSLESSVLEHRVYPWLSFELPVYERWTGRIQYNPPIMADYIKDGSQKKKSTTDSSSSSSSFFLNKLKQKSNGKGLVLSIGDSHVDDTVRLIHLLRALNNKLPIQIVYYDNLSKDTKNKIVTAATDLMTTVPKSFENVARYFPEDYLTNGLPKQEVWFINTYNAIHADFRQKFKKYSNKFLATLFNSFDEFILIDADTVLMQSPEYFFNLPGYIETGTFFYKDRTTYETRPISDAKFFEKLGPSIIDSVMFNIPIMTQYTLDKPFFKGLFHYMESGLVVLNRNIHYNSILMMLQLNFYTTVNGRIHGDKEIFWLAMAINGDENYTFNEHFAASVGKITPQLERAKPDGTEHKSEEICSPHPGHVSSYDDALVWFNSGFHYCGQLDAVDYAKEFSHKSRLKHIQSLEAFETFYRNPLQIEAAIIPPMDLNIHAVNAEDEPSKGWFMDKRYCNGYCWCGYSIIGGNTKEGKNNELVGKVVHFDDKAIELFKYYGDVWVGIE